MKKEKKFFLKIAAMAVLALALTGLTINTGTVSNDWDFLTGFAMGIIIVILLELVYSVIAKLRRQEPL